MFYPYWLGGSNNFNITSGDLSLKFCLVMNGLLTGSFNINLSIAIAIIQADTMTYGLALFKKLKALCEQYPSTWYMLDVIKKNIIDCDENVTECIIDDAINTCLGRGPLQSKGRALKGWEWH